MAKSSVPFWTMALMVVLSLIHWVKEAAQRVAPIGCEDEEGFHLGEPK